MRQAGAADGSRNNAQNGARRSALRWLLPLIALAGSAITSGRPMPHHITQAQAQEDPPPILLPLLIFRAGALPTPHVVSPQATPSSPAPSATSTMPTGSETATAAASDTPGATPTDEEPPPEPTPTTTSTPTLGDCDELPTFEDGQEPSTTLFVATDGDDDTGIGSPDRPYRSIAGAARRARAGTAIRLLPGTYPGGTYLENLHGVATAPIWIGGAPGQANPVIEGGTEALHLIRARYVIVHDLEVRNSSGNGINADDGGEYADPEATRHLIFRDLYIHDIGAGGNQDCLKLSGIDDFIVYRSSFARCGGGGSGSGIDMVGCHLGYIARNHFEDISGNAIQAKGGSEDLSILWNRMRDAGARAINMGGSTGFTFFRPPLTSGMPNAEARRIHVLANRIEGGDTPLAFVGCVDCVAAQNTILHPRIWMMRILQETNSTDDFEFLPASQGHFVNNLIVFRRDQLRADVNVGGNTAPATFTFANNLWYAEDDPGRSAPALPVPETNGIHGEDPGLDAEGRIDSNSPAAGAGLAPPYLTADITGRCFADPPAVGAFEVSP